MLNDLDRRHMLGLGAAGLALGLVDGAKAAEPVSLLDAYLTTRGLIGSTAFWVTRGVKYALVGTRFVPFQRSAVIEAVRFDRSGGLLKSSTLEGAFSMTLDGRLSYEIENPLTHSPVAIKPGTPIVVDYQYETNGLMTIAASSSSRGTVRGGLSWEAADGVPSVREAFEAFTSSPPVGEPVLSEAIVFRPDARSLSAKGYLRASKTAMVLRDWSYPAPPGVSARLITQYEGMKFETMDALIANFGAATIKAVYPDLTERFRAF